MIITFKPYNIIKQIYYKYSKNNKKNWTWRRNWIYIENIKLKSNYKLLDFSIEIDDVIMFDNSEYKYKTIELFMN